MAWQRDKGLPVTGVFNQDCKWAYLKQQVRLARGSTLLPQCCAQRLRSLPVRRNWYVLSQEQGQVVNVLGSLPAVQETRAAEAAAAPVWVTLGSQQVSSPTPLTLVPVWQVIEGAKKRAEQP